MASFSPNLYENIFLQVGVSRYVLVFPGSSAGKESVCDTGDSVSIPGLGRSPGEGIGYPFQYSWASLMAQTVKSTCNAGDLGSIPGWEDPLEKEMATHSSILA